MCMLRQRHRSSPPTGDASFLVCTRPYSTLLIQRLEHLGCVSLGLHRGPDARNSALGFDQESGALDPPVLPSVVLFFNPRAVPVGDLVVLVGKEREGQSELPLEGLLAAGPQHAYAPSL